MMKILKKRDIMTHNFSKRVFHAGYLDPGNYIGGFEPSMWLSVTSSTKIVANRYLTKRPGKRPTLC